jgi:hypothetical protein
MKASKIVRFVNLLLAGTLTGNEFGTLAAVHPALEELSPPERIRAEQEVTRRFGTIMPFWMGSTGVSCVLAMLSSCGPAGFGRTLLGTVCFLSMLTSTRLRNVPINDRGIDTDPREGSGGVRAAAEALGQAARAARGAQRHRNGVFRLGRSL